jgi:SAM-dependent methyltransferase
VARFGSESEAAEVGISVEPGVRCARGELPLPDGALHEVGGDGPKLDRGPRQLHLLRHFGLRPSHDVLEVGCGLGRLAYELASFLDLDATYTGFDIAPAAVRWLTDNYAPRLPGFQFDLLDVANERYNPDGDADPAEVRFPYSDASFDAACAFEVFMHVDLAGVRNYLREIGRVLRPGGLALVSFMAIYPDEDRPRHGGRPFVPIGEGVHTRFPERSGTSMGYDLALIEEALAGAGLDQEAMIRGRWHDPFVIAIEPLSHGCDLFAAHRRGAAD